MHNICIALHLPHAPVVTIIKFCGKFPVPCTTCYSVCQVCSVLTQQDRERDYRRQWSMVHICMIIASICIIIYIYIIIIL